MTTTVRVWDLPTRVFHWSLLACLAGLVSSAQIGGAAMDWHFRFGYTVLSLLIFRLVWGLVGGQWSRFASFAYSPATVMRYLQGQGRPEHSIGHNPLGAISVFALLGFLLLQAASGLISDDEIAATGPLVKWVPHALVNNATFYHKDVGTLILLCLLALHLGAVLFYLFKKGQNLVRPMIRGDKETTSTTQSSRDDARSRALALIVFLSCMALVTGLVTMAG
jgi:cytochrome b